MIITYINLKYHKIANKGTHLRSYTGNAFNIKFDNSNLLININFNIKSNYLLITQVWFC